MSMLSRGGRRSRATLAATFTFSLFTFLVVTALPASAVVASCAPNGTFAFQLDVQAGTDNSFVLAVNGAAGELGAGTLANSYVFSINGGPFTNCGAGSTNAAITHVNIDGAGDGQETVTLFHPTGNGVGDSYAGDLISVDLGNGTDTLVLEYGALAAPAFPDPGTDDGVSLGATAAGQTVLDLTFGGVSDGRIDNAENITINMGAGSDIVNAQEDSLGADAGSALTTSDDMPASTANVAANLTVNAGADGGLDTFFSGDGSDTFNGGPGVDTINYIGSPNGVIVDLAAGTGTGAGNDVLTDVQNAVGSNFADTITGSAIDNPILDGADGDDVINGGDGNDGLFGGLDGPDGDATGGDDTLAGQAGNDVVDGGDGNDTILEDAAANGADVLIGGANGAVGDTLDHSARTASVSVNANDGLANDGAAGEGDNVHCSFENYLGGTAADTYRGCDAIGETFTPGAGDDTVNGGGGFDYLDLSDVAGPAVFDLTAGTATGNGTDAFSNVEGFIGTDANDTVLGDQTTVLGICPAAVGTFDFFGGGGVDLVDASTATGPVCINLALLGTTRDVENATGGAGDDSLLGNEVGNRLVGNAGFDVISGLAGNDYIEGGTGNDTMSGGTGGDTLSYKNSDTGMLVDAQLGFTQGIGGVGDGEDSIGFFEIFLGSSHNDDITGGQTDFDGNIRIKGRQGNDVITGTNSVDVLTGAGGNDVIRGGGGDDTVRGGAGNDTMFGSNGNDFLNGGKGSDEAFGGPGRDLCRAEHEVSC